MTILDFSNPADLYGLDREDARIVNDLLHDYNPKLSFRRVPEADPAFDPNKPWGVYEEGVNASREILSPWVFFVHDSAIDHRVLARIYENDFARQGANALVARNEAMKKALAQTQTRAREEIAEAGRDRALFLAKALQHKTAVRHDFGDGNGRVIIGDGGTRSGRTFII